MFIVYCLSLNKTNLDLIPGLVLSLLSIEYDVFNGKSNAA